MPSVCTVNYNARIYDPELGRFMSADPTVEAPYNPQDLNRYTYVGDNPLAFTDPTGMCFLGCFWQSPIFAAIVSIAIAILRGFTIEVRMGRLFGAGVMAAVLGALVCQPAGARPLVQRLVTVTAADSGRTIAMSPGQKLRVVLPVQAGTGYGWQVVPGSTPLLSWNHVRTIVGPAMRGGPRMQMLKLTAMGTGTGRVRIEYRRPWEGAQRAVSVFTLTVSVGPPTAATVH